MVDSFRQLAPADEAVLPLLREDLRACAHLPKSGSVAGLDEVILGAAARHFSQMQMDRSQRVRGRWSRIAAAAVLALTAILAIRIGVPASTPAQLARDINRDGRADILDAFTLARRIDSGGVLPTAFDIDGDGSVNQRDVDAISARAVSLGIGSSSNARAVIESSGRSGS